MTPNDFSHLKSEVAHRAEMVKSYLFNSQKVDFEYKHLEDATYSYVKAGGKSLRPAVLLFSCGLVGGDETKALPAAAAVEVYHTFTLVHDDIIDHDELRRGVPTVHVDFANRARAELHYDDERAEHYGLAVAILAGDMQQGWAASTLASLHSEFGVNPTVALNLTFELFRNVQRTLVNGETLDIVLSEMPLERVTEDAILHMIWQKTGSLYEFCGRAGAAIGLNQPDLAHPDVAAVANFTSRCGTAFQIQDDVLGVVGNVKQLGKPVGSDIREGKRTLVLMGALRSMTAAQREFMLSVLGNHEAELPAIQEAIGLLQAAGGIAYAQEMARRYVTEAKQYLEPLPASEYKDLLLSWANYIIEREL